VRWAGLGCCRCQATLPGLPACLGSLPCQVPAPACWRPAALQHPHVLLASPSHRLPASLPAHLGTFLSPCQPQFERESSRALSKELVAARERWRSTEAERAAAEDLRRRVSRPQLLLLCSLLLPVCLPLWLPVSCAVKPGSVLLNWLLPTWH
jgi:hypothetical protein